MKNVEIISVHYKTPDLIYNQYTSVRKFYPELPYKIIDGSDNNVNYFEDLEIKDINFSVKRFGYNIHHGPGMDSGIKNSEYEYQLILESKGQLTEQRIIEVALLNIIDNLERILKLIPNNLNGTTGEIIIVNENHTIGNLLSYGLQKHKNIKFAGYNMPHLLEEKIVIHYELIDEKFKIDKIFNDVVLYFNELFNEFLKLNSNLFAPKTIKKTSKKIKKSKK
jgi:DNA-directed RNA polymerase subunit L